MVISGRDNPKIKHLIKLMSDRRTRTAEGVFVIEGLRSCADAAKQFLDGGMPELTAVFISQRALKKYGETQYFGVIDRLDERIRFYITDELADRISDSMSSQGVFAIARMLDKKLAADIVKYNGRYVVLDNIQDPGNLGTIIRTSDAVGVDGAVLTANCCDLYNPKCVRSAMGSISRIDCFIENDFDRVINVFSEKKVKNIASVVSGGEDLVEFDFPEGCAVYIGNEGSGMPEEHVRLCDKRLTISMHGSIESLNAAMAATIILWEMMRGNS